MRENRGFRDLVAWQVAMEVVELTYRLTAAFPDTERYGLISQMRRAAVSVPSNIAEAQPMRSPKWGLRFVLNALGSSCELDTQLEAAVRLKLCSATNADELRQRIDRVQKLLYGLKREKEGRLLTAGTAICLVLLITVHWIG